MLGRKQLVSSGDDAYDLVIPVAVGELGLTGIALAFGDWRA